MNSDGFTLVTRTSKKTGVVAEPGDGIIFESDNMRRKKKRGTLLKSDFYTFQRQVNKFDSEYRYVPVTLISLHFMEVLSMQSCQNCEPSSRMIKTGLPRSRRRESSNPIERAERAHAASLTSQPEVAVYLQPSCFQPSSNGCSSALPFESSNQLFRGHMCPLEEKYWHMFLAGLLLQFVANFIAVVCIHKALYQIQIRVQ
jgi:hypothetical protein